MILSIGITELRDPGPPGTLAGEDHVAPAWARLHRRAYQIVETLTTVFLKLRTPYRISTADLRQYSRAT